MDETISNRKKLKVENMERSAAQQAKKGAIGAIVDTRKRVGISRGKASYVQNHRATRKTHQCNKRPKKDENSRVRDSRPAKKRMMNTVPPRRKKNICNTQEILPSLHQVSSHMYNPRKTSPRNTTSTLPHRLYHHQRWKRTKEPQNASKKDDNTRKPATIPLTADKHAKHPSNDEKMAARQEKENIRNLALTSSGRGKDFIEETTIDSSLH